LLERFCASFPEVGQMNKTDRLFFEDVLGGLVLSGEATTVVCWR
jgi:hypothetical protein